MSAPSNGFLLWQHPSVWIALSTCHCSLIENKWQFNLLHTYTRLTWRVITPGPISSIYFVLLWRLFDLKAVKSVLFCRHDCQYRFICLFLWSLTIDWCFEKSVKEMFHSVWSFKFCSLLLDCTNNKKNVSLNNWSPPPLPSSFPSSLWLRPAVNLRALN